MSALRRSSERRGSASVLLIVGLANPGEEFESSRHNVGGDAVRLAAKRHGATLTLERRQRAMSTTLPTPRGSVTLAVPTTFMNESGSAVAPLMRRTSLEDPAHLVIVHDELDLEPGRVQLKMGGGLAGHNGLRSIAQVLGTNDFIRLRIGVGKPRTKEEGANFVLARLRGAKKAERDNNVTLAADAIDALIDEGFDGAQRRVNAPRG
ncbi:MAG: aminoacyl-tRNA hydrolase [Acidimicrobiales bacterium]